MDLRTFCAIPALLRWIPARTDVQIRLNVSVQDAEQDPDQSGLTLNTLIDALENSARHAADRGISIFDRRGQNAQRRTYAELLELATDRAARLAAAGIAPGQRVLVCLPTSWELLELYFGVLLRGAYPVLVAPPGALGGAAAHAKKIGALRELLDPKHLICDDSTRRELTEFGEQSAAAASVTYAELTKLAPSGGDPIVRPKAADLAFMQLTSGSTGRQRAVQITHSCVINNTRGMNGFVPDTGFARETVLSWLPLNHDMGLVGCLLYSLVYGQELHLLRPETFLARPRQWLQLFGATKATLSPAPNFAYQLCVERIGADELAGLDLSSWKVALSGAEMIRPETCSAFVEKFSDCKFHPESYIGSYGMAEATLAATCDIKRRGIRTQPIPAGYESGVGQNEVVCTGVPVLDTEAKIVSAASSHETLAECRVGEVWLKGPGIFAGYYNDPGATKDTLVNGWLRTGDLGFLKDGELYLTGRIKDVLIIHGHNLMPHELEWIAEGVAGGGGTERCGAFSVSRDATEQAVLVMEVAEKDGAQLSSMDKEIRSRIGKALGLPLADLVFIKRGQIPKTTSGKVQRRELRQRYLDGRLERIGF